MNKNIRRFVAVLSLTLAVSAAAPSAFAARGADDRAPGAGTVIRRILKLIGISTQGDAPIGPIPAPKP